MQNRKRITTCLAIALACFAVCSQASTQDEPLRKKKEPVTSGGQLDVKLGSEVLDGFKTAYESDDYPRWITIVGIDARAFGGQDGHRKILGQESPILFFDPTGISDMLQTRLNFWLRKNRDLDLINLSEIADADRRIANSAAEVDASVGVDMLAERARADLVYYVEIRAIPDDLKGANESMFIATIQLRDRRTARSIYEDSFRWSGRADMRYMNMLAVKSLERVLPEYAEWVDQRPSHVPMEFTIYGLSDQQQLEIRGMVSDFNGVKGRVRSDVQRKGTTTLTNIRFRYRGDIAAMLLRLNKMASQELGIEFRTLDLRDSTATLSAQRLVRDEGWVVFAESNTPEGEKAVAELQRGYLRRGSPRIGVIIDPADEEVGFSVRGLTSELSNHFSRAGLQVETVLGKVDGDFGDLGFEVVVLGETNNDPDANGEMVFSVYDVRSDRFIASQAWPDLPVINSRTRPVSPGDRGQVTEFIAARLMERMSNDFLAMGTVDVVMHFPKNTRIVTSFARALETGTTAVVSASNIDAGPDCASFVIRYNGRFEDLVTQIESIQDRFAVALAGAYADSSSIELVVLEDGQTLADVEIPESSACDKRRVEYTRPEGSGSKGSSPSPTPDKNAEPAPVRRPNPSNPDPVTEPEPNPSEPTPAPNRGRRSPSRGGSAGSVSQSSGVNDEVLRHQQKLSQVDQRITVPGGAARQSINTTSESKRLAFDGILVIREPTNAAQAQQQGLTFDSFKKAVLGEIEVINGRRGTAADLKSKGLEDELRSLRADPTVAAAIPNYISYSSELQNETALESGQWALENSFHVGSSANWKPISQRAATIQPSLIGLVDAGMHVDDPRLKPMLWVNRGEVAGNGIDDDKNGYIDDVNGYNFVAKNSNIAFRPTSSSHGSFCGSIMAARAAGQPTDMTSIAPRASIIMANVFPDIEHPGARFDHVLEGLLYAAFNGAKVINMSLGSEVGKDDLRVLAEALRPIFKLLKEKNIIVVVAAGNDGKNIDQHPQSWASLPFDNIITVAATDPDGDLGKIGGIGRWQLFSNYGARGVDIAAPGSLIFGISKLGETQSGFGTSYSAPMVTATIALVQGQHPEWDYKTVIRAITETARPYEALQGKVRTGGSLDIEAALNWTP